MKRVDTRDLIPGMAAAEEVISKGHFIKLLESGARLTPVHIAQLRSWGVPFVTVEDEACGLAALAGGVNRTEGEFLAIYTDILKEVVDAFRDFEKVKKVPMIGMQELAGHKIALLAETVGAIEFLYKMQCHSERTFQHSLNVAVVAGVMGKWLGCQETALKSLILTGLLHDVGKLTVPLSILEKPGPLSPEEYAVIKRHSQEGYRLVKASGQVDDGVGFGILQHHERLDGSGYPAGLTGKAICAEAEVIAIADTYDAMTSDRAYRRKLTPFEAMEAIADSMFDKLNTTVSMTFLDNMQDRLTGCRVALSCGQTATVIGFTARDRYFTKPVVCTEKGELIDLLSGEICITGIR